jgi:hypothetical protein
MTMIVVNRGLFFLGPAILVLAVVERSWVLAAWAVGLILLNGAFWLSDRRTGWISRPRRK